MARKTAAVKSSSTTTTTTSTTKAAMPPKGVAGKVASSTPVRNTAIPKVAAAAAAPMVATKREITREMIAVRAFEISMGGTGGSEFDNWIRAERELRAGV